MDRGFGVNSNCLKKNQFENMKQPPEVILNYFSKGVPETETPNILTVGAGYAWPVRHHTVMLNTDQNLPLFFLAGDQSVIGHDPEFPLMDPGGRTQDEQYRIWNMYHKSLSDITFKKGTLHLFFY